MTPDEKRQQIDAIYSTMILIAKSGNEIIKVGQEAASEDVPMLTGPQQPGESASEYLQRLGIK